MNGGSLKLALELSIVNLEVPGRTLEGQSTAARDSRVQVMSWAHKQVY